MYFVYCLTSGKNNKFHYYGFTSNLNERLKCHNSGKVATTKRFLPVKLLGYREFLERSDALQFEKDLKSKASYRKKFISDLVIRESKYNKAHLPA